MKQDRLKVTVHFLFLNAIYRLIYSIIGKLAYIFLFPEFLNYLGDANQLFGMLYSPDF